MKFGTLLLLTISGFLTASFSQDFFPAYQGSLYWSLDIGSGTIIGSTPDFESGVIDIYGISWMDADGAQLVEYEYASVDGNLMVLKFINERISIGPSLRYGQIIQKLRKGIGSEERLIGKFDIGASCAISIFNIGRIKIWPITGIHYSIGTIDQCAALKEAVNPIDELGIFLNSRTEKTIVNGLQTGIQVRLQFFPIAGRFFAFLNAGCEASALFCKKNDLPGYGNLYLNLMPSIRAGAGYLTE